MGVLLCLEAIQGTQGYARVGQRLPPQSNKLRASGQPNPSAATRRFGAEEKLLCGRNEISQANDAVRAVSPSRISSRRHALFGIWAVSGAGCFQAMVGNPSLAMAVDATPGGDPFAQLDAFAGTLSSNGSNSGTKGSSMPTGVDGSKTAKEAPSAPPTPQGNDMEAALRESRSKRQIDPRTHG